MNSFQTPNEEELSHISINDSDDEAT